LDASPRNRPPHNMTPTLVERGTKPFIIVSLIGAGAMTVTTAIEWPLLPWASVAALVASHLAARRFHETVVSGWLLVTYLAPALAMLGLGDFRGWDLTPWFAGLIGAMTATADPTRWHLPAQWRAPLVGWGLVVAVSWPVVWLRELDFAPTVVSVADVANNGAGVPSGIALLWVYGVVTVHLLGLLLLDWLFATFGQSDRARFQRVVLMPLALSWIGAWLVGLYQSVVDPAFLNLGFWAATGRASGTLMDANPFGMIAALWGAIGVALVLGRPPSAAGGLSPTARLALAVLVLVASWYGLWVSGSRSALGAGAVVLVFALWQIRGLTARVPRGRLAGVGVAGVLLVGAVWIGAGSSSLMVGPWERLAPQRPSASVASVRAAVFELWDRYSYGATATRMIADSPLVGVGVGSFRLVVPDVAHQLGHGRLRPDNAQNWFRHQVAEFGVIGGLGWVLWVAMFLRLLVVGRAVEGGACRPTWCGERWSHSVWRRWLVCQPRTWPSRSPSGLLCSGTPCSCSRRRDVRRAGAPAVVRGPQSGCSPLSTPVGWPMCPGSTSGCPIVPNGQIGTTATGFTTRKPSGPQMNFVGRPVTLWRWSPSLTVGSR
jgi:hypothetical protein